MEGGAVCRTTTDIPGRRVCRRTTPTRRARRIAPGPAPAPNPAPTPTPAPAPAPRHHGPASVRRVHRAAAARRHRRTATIAMRQTISCFGPPCPPYPG
ncbi:hypothetical protein F2P45_00090 [Massilia sp. CCM 8733]|uniref:Uncharacterized protein n=1 Tax=Massilia mucilaginosa TaxID=2609282 RepID=A0ABX0NKX1_9BURK|nr:hypothetical protein [Massilia mucilaginosa]